MFWVAKNLAVEHLPLERGLACVQTSPSLKENSRHLATLPLVSPPNDV